MGIAAPITGRRCGQKETGKSYEEGVCHKRRVWKLKDGDMRKRFEKRVGLRASKFWSTGFVGFFKEWSCEGL